MDRYGQNQNVNLTFGDRMMEAIRRATQNATASSSQNGGYGNVYRPPTSGYGAGQPGQPGAPGLSYPGGPGAASSGGTRPGPFTQYLNGGQQGQSGQPGQPGQGFGPGNFPTQASQILGANDPRLARVQWALDRWHQMRGGTPPGGGGTPGQPPGTPGGQPPVRASVSPLVPGQESSAGNVPGPFLPWMKNRVGSPY